MQITNKLGLPESFVQMAQRDYVVEDKVYRVTSLLKGIKETILERRYHKKIEQDCSDMIWLLFGTAVHSVLEKQTETDTEIKEQRINVFVGDCTLSGQFDLYCGERKRITDYKTASIWKIVYADFSDWRKQLLIYSYMMRCIGFEVERGEVVALLKDHSKSKAKRDKDYPQQPVVRINFEFSEKDFKEIEEWLTMRFKEIEDAEKLKDEELPECTPEERWNSGDKYAVMKGKNKRAVRVLDSAEEAEQWMISNPGKGGDWVDVRKGINRKCEDYCSCNQFCDYYLRRD